MGFVGWNFFFRRRVFFFVRGARFWPRDKTVGRFLAVSVIAFYDLYLYKCDSVLFQSSVMVLKNMVSFEDVDDDLENEVCKMGL